MANLPHRPCLALPFTILPSTEGVHLVAGEDWRYVLSGAGLATWLPAWLTRVDGTLTRDQLLADLPLQQQREALAVLQRLQGERLLSDGPIEADHLPLRAGVEVLGTGTLADSLREAFPAAGESSLVLLVQESLDYGLALAENARLRQQRRRWFWVCSGAMTRGYVSPLFLPDAGPCLACLLDRFRGLSPAPHLYDLLETQNSIRPSPLPREVSRVLQALTVVKVAQASEQTPPPGLYRLHVLEADTLEVTTHPVPRNPDCAVCGNGP